MNNTKLFNFKGKLAIRVWIQKKKKKNMKEAFCKRRPFIHVFKNTNQLGIKESFEVKNGIELRYQKKE
jgi:hypothetical protein